MKVKIVILLLIIGKFSVSQNPNIKEFNIEYSKNETIKLDSNCIVPGSLYVYHNDSILISSESYTIDLINASIFFSDTIFKNLKIIYQTFPLRMIDGFRNRDTTLIVMDLTNRKKMTSLSEPNNRIELLEGDQLSKQGSISRGINVGNNQDLAVSSNLNLQLSGKINEETSILAVISDENIPVQADGSTSQIQEFDKIFIQLSIKKNTLVAGDFELRNRFGFFNRYFKKVKGISYRLDSLIPEKTTGVVNFAASGAIVKGKYNRQKFLGNEGNQGPYKLHGAANELYIIVLSGSEKVYLNGKLLNRGENEDYIIDYNSAELIFTTNQPITKDSRIIVEFEYSERSYARYLFSADADFTVRKNKIWFNLYSESDNKNQPFLQNLSQSEKEILNMIGDNETEAITSSVDSITFDNNKILYRKADTLVNNVLYQDVYIYSTNPNIACFVLNFSFVGANKGNYKQIQNNANGRVFEWVAPVNSLPQGDYEPIKILMTPKLKQMVSIGGTTKFNNHLASNFEFSYSKHDKNTFSKQNDDDNQGVAIKLDVKRFFIGNDSTEKALNIILKYNFLHKNFSPIEHINDTEFERNWNLESANRFEHENACLIQLNYRNSKQFAIKYNMELLNRFNFFNGLNNSVFIDANYKKWSSGLGISYLTTMDTVKNSNFLRYNFSNIYRVKKIATGIHIAGENNIWKNRLTDSLMANSLQFSEVEIFVKSSDSSKINSYVSYKFRKDFQPILNKFVNSSTANEISFKTDYSINKLQRLTFTVNYRLLKIVDSITNANDDNRNLIGKVEHFLKQKNEFFYLNSSFGTATGQEQQREFSYIEVPAGQGIYTWVDYNSNNIKELNEFEIASFSDEAKYIKFFLPSNNYVRAYNSFFSEILTIQPEKRWRNKTGIKKIASKLYNQCSFRYEQKSLVPIYNKNWNADSLVVSNNMSFRNILALNRRGMLSFEYTFQKQANKQLLANGIDKQGIYNHGFVGLLKIKNYLNIQNESDVGEKEFVSEFFSQKNYTIKLFSNESKMVFIFSSYNIDLSYKFSIQNNKSGDEKSRQHKCGIEFSINTNGGNLIITGDYYKIKFEGNENTSVSYIMLNGLQNGNNFVWSAVSQISLAGNLQLNLNYSGRKSESNSIIHTGGIQLRAIF